MTQGNISHLIAARRAEDDMLSLSVFRASSTTSPVNIWPDGEVKGRFGVPVSFVSSILRSRAGGHKIQVSDDFESD